MFKRSLGVRKHGLKQYSGDACQICKSIVEDCWSGDYFFTSTGHFRQFWVRDLSYFVEPLIWLGQTGKLQKSYKYALGQFMKHDKVTTTLTPNGVPFDVFTFSADSLPLLLRSIRFLDIKLDLSARRFLQKEIDKYYKTVVGPDGMVRRDRSYSSAKDNANRISSLYDNVMVWILQQESGTLGLKTGPEVDYAGLIKEKFWKSGHFIEDLSGQDIVSGDANVIPYWAGLYISKSMMKDSIDAIQRHKLDRPLPLKYTEEKVKGQYLKLLELVVPNYEGNSIWTQWGLLYIHIVSKVDKRLARKYLDSYKEMIESNKTFIEVLSPDGRIFKTAFYYADEGMIWASMYPYLESILTPGT
jgi:hypothetical protein